MAYAEILVVAGGGGGGKNGSTQGGGGGGGGGVVHHPSKLITAGSYDVIVGEGGTAGTTGYGGDGGNSVFDDITAIGGGGGGYTNHNGRSGGSGGGDGSYTTGGGTATQTDSGGGTGYGNNGGSGHTDNAGGGGGGAGSAGESAPSSSDGGDGGTGYTSSISGTSRIYAAGGGGGTSYNFTPGSGTAGVSGNGSGNASPGGDGTDGRGGGGGGGGYLSGTYSNGGKGGKGVVIIRYLTTDFKECTGGTITTDGDYTIHTFTSSGTFLVTETIAQTITAKASIQKSFSQTSNSKAFINKNYSQNLVSKASIVLLGNSVLAKANIRSNIIKTLNVKSNLVNSFSKTITSKTRITTTKIASILAQACIRNEVYETVRQVAPKIEIQWDGITWIDESTYFLSAQGNEQLSGINGQGIASTLDVELDNTSDRFTPNNVDSPLYGYIKPRVPIRIETIIGTSFRLFTGYIKNFHPDVKSKICSLECYDNQVLVSNKEANGIVYEDNRTDELLTTLATLAELDPSQYIFEVGLHIVNFGYFENRNVWPVMGELAIAERGRIFFDRYGILRFWNRDHLHNQTSIITLTQNDWILDLDYSIAEHDIKNYVTVQAKPRASAGIQVVWSNGDVQYLDAYSDTLILIPANGTQSAWLELEDPCSTFITPVSGTDFIANSEQDGSGTDLTNNIFVNEFINYGDSVYVSVVNTGSTDAYLTKFQIRGNPAQVLNYIQVNVQDTTSISLYGKQDETIENNFIQDEGSATEIAYEELWRRQDAVNNFDINIMGIPYLLCGDLVSVEYIKGSYNNYLIEQISWTLDSGGFKQKLRLITPYIFPSIQRIDARATIVGGHYIKTLTSKGNITV